MSRTFHGAFRPALLLAATAMALVAVADPVAGAPAVGAHVNSASSTTPHHQNGRKILPVGARVVRAAAAQAGDPYVYGAAGPNAFDCSGLSLFAYRIAAHKQLPHNSAAQQGSTRRITARAARRGDLVFFHDGGGSVYHVAIFAGRGNVWHAPYPGASVRREHIWTSAVTYGRVR